MQESNDLYILLAILGGIVLMIILTRIINAHSQVKYAFKPITLSRTLFIVLAFGVFIALVFIYQKETTPIDNPAAWFSLLALISLIVLMIYLCVKTNILIGILSTLILLAWGFLSTAGLVFVLGYLIYRKMGKTDA